MSAPSTTLIPIQDTETQVAILRALNLDPKDPKTQALVMTCARYGLDPLLKHAVLIQGSLYVTRDGLLHVAHSSGKFDGIEVEVLADSSTHFVARATVWRKDMSHPFVYQGRYPKSGQMAKHGPEMAEKVAECRALRRAFSIALCSREETWEEADPTPVVHQARVPAPKAIAAAPVDPATVDQIATKESRADFYAACDALKLPIRDSNRKPIGDRVMAVLHFLGWPHPIPPPTAADWDQSTTLLTEASADHIDKLRASMIPTSDLTDPFTEEAPTNAN